MKMRAQALSGLAGEERSFVRIRNVAAYCQT